MNSVKDMVKDNKVVRFQFYRDQSLFYETECGSIFPVPINDIGNATFMAEDKALLFMRYIRKHIDVIKKEKEEYGEIKGS
jgi:hypothetical protein